MSFPRWTGTAGSGFHSTRPSWGTLWSNPQEGQILVRVWTILTQAIAVATIELFEERCGSQDQGIQREKRAVEFEWPTKAGPHFLFCEGDPGGCERSVVGADLDHGGE